jgi:hypothetical protein
MLSMTVGREMLGLYRLSRGVKERPEAMAPLLAEECRGDILGAPIVRLRQAVRHQQQRRHAARALGTGRHRSAQRFVLL